MNDKERMILDLWKEAMSPEDIALKLGIEEEEVLCVIENEPLYKEVADAQGIHLS